VFDFLPTQGKSFLLVVCGNVVDFQYGFRPDVDREELLVKPLVFLGQHGVVIRMVLWDRDKSLDTQNARNSHVLDNFGGIGAPWSDHGGPGTNKKGVQ